LPAPSCGSSPLGAPLLAGCFTLAKGAIFGLETAAIAVGVLLILQQARINPALLVLGAAVVGMLSFD
jgi:chromate transporter